MLDPAYSLELSNFRTAGKDVPADETARHRYKRYRLDGMAPELARRAALAFERNMREQRERRRSHGTGAT